MEGFIKLYRKLLESPVFQNERLLKVFIWCLLKASWKDHEQLVGLKTVQLKPSEFIYGRLKGAKELNIKPSTLNDYMQALKRLQIIDIQSNNKFSIVSIVNWGLYQGKEKESDIKPDSNPTTTRQQPNTNKKVNKEKNIYSVSFEEFWDTYPRRKEKSKAFKTWTTMLKEGYKEEELILAASNYKKDCIKDSREEKYIKLAATFLGPNKPFEDYLQVEPVPKIDKHHTERTIEEIFRKEA